MYGLVVETGLLLVGFVAEAEVLLHQIPQFLRYKELEAF